MAKIHGIQLKAIKKARGYEGCGFMANVYLDNKKVGEVYDGGCGAPLDVEFEEGQKDKVLSRIYDYYEQNPKLDGDKLSSLEEYVEREKNGTLPMTTYKDKNWHTVCEYFFYDLMTLTEFEKGFKQELKKGYKLFVKLKYPFLAGRYRDPLIYKFETNDNVEGCVQYVKNKAAWPAYTIHVYKSLEDFIID